MSNWKFFILIFVTVLHNNVVRCDENISKENDDKSAEVVEAKNSGEIYTEAPLSGKNNEVDTTAGVVKYNGAQLWRIPYTNQTFKNAVIELQKNFQIPMWNLQKSYVDVFVKQPVVKLAKALLKTSNVPFEVVIDDLQKAIDDENPPKEQIVEWQVRNGHPLTWIAYHRLADIHKYLDFLATTYPDLCSVQSIGKSLENRDMKLLKVSNGNPSNQAFWIDGGIHAREWISPATVTFIINELTENWEEQPDYIKNIDWYFLPVQNPDGYEYSHTRDRYWRKNRRRAGIFCRGVDLNRNYGFKWGGEGTSRWPCSEVYAGAGPFSEPETKAVRDFFMNSTAKFKASLSFHSYGQYILYPWGYDKSVPEDHMELNEAGKNAAKAIKSLSDMDYTVGPSGAALYPAAGGSDDWARGVMNIKYAYTIELRDSGRFGFNLPAAQIKPTGEETMKMIDEFAKAVSNANSLSETNKLPII